ncbi:hypothetical protein cypCar_00006515 [Cyprinus carpio]|nr:hypothetical protein cypCar_00006515 [Cyprinus carpio]
MRVLHFFMLLGLGLFLLAAHSEALKCYTCMGSTDEDCNRQGSKTCPSYSDACAVVRGHGNLDLKDKGLQSKASEIESSEGGKRALCRTVHPIDFTLGGYVAADPMECSVAFWCNMDT